MSGDITFRHRWVLHVGQEAGLSDGARLLGVMAIMKFGKPDQGQEFWPSHRALAELVGVSERTAERRMSELVRVGLLRKRSTGGRTSNRYMATFPRPDSSDGVAAASDPGSRDINPDNIDINPDSSDGVTPTPVSDEQIQEQIHQQIQEQADTQRPVLKMVRDVLGPFEQVRLAESYLGDEDAA